MRRSPGIAALILTGAALWLSACSSVGGGLSIGEFRRRSCPAVAEFADAPPDPDTGVRSAALFWPEPAPTDDGLVSIPIRAAMRAAPADDVALAFYESVGFWTHYATLEDLPAMMETCLKDVERATPRRRVEGSPIRFVGGVGDKGRLIEVVWTPDLPDVCATGATSNGCVTIRAFERSQAGASP